MTVVAKGIQYRLSNGKVVNSLTKDTKWIVSLDRHSIVVASVPETSPEEYSLVTLLNNDGKWVMAKYPKTPFTMPKGAKRVSVHGRDAWVMTNHPNSVTFAFTLDEGNVVLVGGDVDEKQAITVLRSLPLASSRSFPFSR